jgi:hypothetical protein
MRAECESRRRLVQTLAAKSANVFFAAAIISSLSILILWCSKQASEPPTPGTISMCLDSSVTVDWLLTDFDLRFHVPAHTLSFRSIPKPAVTIHLGHKDMPPSNTYVVSLNGYAPARLWISSDSRMFRDLEISYPTFSETKGHRVLRDSLGRSFGTDSWGYLRSGERWRYVSFSTGGYAGYLPLPTNQADKLDDAINSACFSPDDPLNK